MNSNEKRWIVLLVAVILIAVILIVVLTTGKKNETPIAQGGNTNQGTVNEEKYTVELDDGTKLNTSEDFNKTKTYNNLEISNIQFTEKDGMTVLLADVKNTGSTNHAAEIVKLELLDENGNVITDTNPVIGDIKPGETGKINTTLTGDAANAKDFRITAAK